MYKGACVYALIAPHTKMYIGQTIAFKKRMWKHKSEAYNKTNGEWESEKHLQRGIRKHGWENMHLYIFEKYDKNLPDILEVLDKREKFYIAKYGTFDRSKGYNLTKGGGGCKGWKHTEESRAHQALAQSKPEYKAKIISSLIGNSRALGSKRTPEQNRANSERMKGRVFTDEHKKKIGDYFKGKKQSQDHINKRTASLKIPVIATDGEGNETEYKSATYAAKKLTEKYGKKFSRSHISACCRGDSKTHRGMTFRLKDPESRKRKRKD